MSASGLSTVHGFALHRIKEYKWWCMYTLFREGDCVMTAGGKTEWCQWKPTTPLSAATRREESLAAEQHPVATTLGCCLYTGFQVSMFIFQMFR